MNIDWINGILPTITSKLIAAAFFTVLPYFIRQIIKVSTLEKRVNRFFEYGTNIPPTKCPICLKKGKIALVHQQNIKGGYIENTFMCPMCGETFKQVISPSGKK